MPLSAALACAALLTCASAGATVRESLQNDGGVETLASALRRQLMKHNDDYEPTDTSDEENDQNTLRHYYKHSIQNSSRSAQQHEWSEPTDSEVLPGRSYSRYRAHASPRRGPLADQTAAGVKYRVLKLREQYRRSGAAAALIQEESPDGVAVLNLGPGPFPEFSLPGQRRQYMSAPQPLRSVREDEEELPPPSAADPERAPHPHAHLGAGELNSLIITVTPDEIFVLK